VGAEERGQSEAIARNLRVMARLRTPILCTVVGEGGSGGALAIGVGDRTLMLQYSTYSVISPEGCASILWKSADKAQLAAEAMAITSDKLKDQGLVDIVIPEPLGGAHRDPDATGAAVKAALLEQLDVLQSMDLDTLVAERHARLRGYGRFKE
jgi:acetyl-CoA carboxylase carboxyl transferase subunit alpha